MSQNHQPPHDASSHPGLSSLGPALLSLVVPGSGQFVLRERMRGVILLVAIAVLAALIRWQSALALIAPLAALWLWGAWDAYRLATGRRARPAVPLLLVALIVYGLGFKATEVRPARLVTGLPGVVPYLRALTEPELMAHPTEDVRGTVPIQVPCIDPLPAPSVIPSKQPLVTTSVPCAEVGDSVVILGDGFAPNAEGALWWQNPIGDMQQLTSEGKQIRFVADAAGRFAASLKVPLAVPINQLPKEGETQTHVIFAEQQVARGGWVPTQTLSLVLEKIGETVAMAFIATVLGMFFAIPVSFLAARNLMSGNRATRILYFVVRALLNIVRSIETLMWAIVFVVWVGVGPFGGMLALFLHTVAALGKLYSEAIESIDPGPIEALRATGANGLQVIVYAVLPQIVPTFLSFTLYRWDINVRMSTVIGLISDAGLGFLLIQWIRLNNLRAMATSIIAIVLVVAILDYTSAWLRERIIAGTPAARRPSPLRRGVVTGVLLVLFAVAFVWSWGIAQIRLFDLVEGVPDGVRMLGDFAVPRLFTRPTQEHSVGVTLPVPCGTVEQETAPEDGARVDLSLACGDVGDPLVIHGYGLPADADVSVRWVLSDGAFLRIKENCCTTDGSGNLTLETRVSPLMAVDEATNRASPGRVEIVWKEVIGGPRLSDELKQVVDLSLVTLLMALLATTLGSLFAIPLSFFAARNITGRGPVGRAVYFGFRTIFNLWRSVEPMILAVICAAWVGLGPFAGVLALALNNIPNLGKLFSETIEEIDTGPVEAITATGANRFQTLVYAIVPQLVPKFLAFILYQWDINIRMSTVIGYVGGGGIGQFFRQNVQLNQYSAAGMAVWAIVIMVWAMDYASARARERLT
ncbi:MAG TPA: phosphonate ABC transporter, permease protein PhnE [Anaerolineae bacterium]|nr:phosphonate ABC transporter, permease protein PhnE [Anaerolineae bacterium]